MEALRAQLSQPKAQSSQPIVDHDKPKRRLKLTERETVTYKEIAHSNMMSIEALVSLLTRKGLITEQEILDELKAIKARDEQEKN
jgi:hypothetical protein